MKLITLTKLLLIPILTCTLLIAEVQKIGAVAKIKGNVLVKPAKGGNYSPAYKGQILSSGDWIKTGDNVFVAIIFLDATMLKIHENSEIELSSQRLSPYEQATKLYLKQGELWTKVKKRKQSEFKVTTPVSVASVKGTEFDLEMDTFEQTSTLIVVAGIVEFQNELGSVLAREMMASKTSVGQPPEPPKKISKSNLPVWQKTIEPTWGFNLKPEKTGRQPINDPLKVAIQVIDNKKKTYARDFDGDVSISADVEWLQISGDGSIWSNSVTSLIAGGKGTVLVKSLKDGNPAIVVTADDAESQKLILNFYQTKTQKRTMQSKIESIINKKGFSELKELLKNRTLKASTFSIGKGDINEILQKLDTGEYEIVKITPTENPDKTISLKIEIKPRKQGGS